MVIFPLFQTQTFDLIIILERSRKQSEKITKRVTTMNHAIEPNRMIQRNHFLLHQEAKKTDAGRCQHFDLLLLVTHAKTWRL